MFNLITLMDKQNLKVEGVNLTKRGATQKNRLCLFTQINLHLARYLIFTLLLSCGQEEKFDLQTRGRDVM